MNNSIQINSDTFLTLTLDDIKTYDKNPRFVKNPCYDEIKSSIKQTRKLNTPLKVTRRPGEDHYILSAGGNTRLQILNELWLETKDEHFRRLGCFYEDWSSDADLMTAHLIENDLRGKLTHMERAIEIKLIKDEYEVSTGQVFGLRELERYLKAKGLSLSRRMLSRYKYITDFLLPLIPKALENDLGTNDIDLLRKINVCYIQCLQNYGCSPTNFEAHYAQVLLDHDDEHLDIESVQRDLDKYVMQLSQQPLNKVRMDIDELMMFSPLNKEPMFADIDDNPSISDFKDYQLDAEEVQSPEARHEADTPAPLHVLPGPAINLEISLPDSTKISEINSETGLIQRASLIRQKEEPPKMWQKEITKISDLINLRGQCLDLARKAASGSPIPLNLKPWLEEGFGFYLDLPDQPISDEIEYFLFWFLLGLSGQHQSNERIKLAAKANMQFAQQLLSENPSAPEKIVGMAPPVDQLSPILFCAKTMPDEAVQALFELMQVCRYIQTHFPESEIFKCMTLAQCERYEAVVNGRVEPQGYFDDDNDGVENE